MTTPIVLKSYDVLVLADGKTDAAKNNARGHLFEVFIAQLFQDYGCSEPRTEALNVRADGIELDVVTTFRLTQKPAIAECKAHSTNIPAKLLTQFYGKLSLQRLEQSRPDLFGWFVALPGLTADGDECARTLSSHDENFRVIRPHDIINLLREKKRIPAEPEFQDPYSDFRLLITPHGVYSAAKELDPVSRLPISVRVWGESPAIPEPVISLIGASDYAAKIDVQPLYRQSETTSTRHHLSQPTLVDVTGSSSDFEYQPPASPQFFIGRKDLLKGLSTLWDSDVAGGEVVVINAQSGWGKSSLALQLRDRVEKSHGLGFVFDTRTAREPEYVWAALRRALTVAEKQGILQLPETASFGGLQSAMSTARDSVWLAPRKPLLVFFDQFENVFRDTRLTQEFRDLALLWRELPHPAHLAFAWKTDIVGWTEDYPYQFRDDIRSASLVVVVDPLGPNDVGQLLGRLEKASGTKIPVDLKQRLREYSQGLPWLFKKLASHILREVESGASPDDLLADSLNVQKLFENDLAQLMPNESESIRTIARTAPVLISDAVERVSPGVIQSLLDRRLVVQVGENLDIYWDTFRDFLNTGKVAIEDTYILRARPAYVRNLLKALLDAGGDLAVADAAERLRTTERVIQNGARELRQLGVLVSVPNRVRIVEDIKAAADVEEAVRSRIATALKRHKVFTMLSAAISSQGGAIPIEQLASQLPEAFPAVNANAKSWSVYAQAFVHWFRYAGLVTIAGRGVNLGNAGAKTYELLKGDKPQRFAGRRSRGEGSAFPQIGPNPTFRLAEFLVFGGDSHGLTSSTATKALTNLISLNFVDHTGTSPVVVAANLFSEDRVPQLSVWRNALLTLPGAKAALEVLASEPRAGDLTIGRVLRDALGGVWADSTSAITGKYFRSWARAVGALPPRRHQSPQEHLWNDADSGPELS